MQVFHGIDGIPSGYGPTVVSVGNFDGVHCGHRSILAHMSLSARRLGARSVVVTFDPHPMRVLRPARAPRLITPMPHRLELLAQTGLDAVVVLPFNAELAAMQAEHFATSLLRDALAAVEVHEGENFRFGHGARAGVAELARLGKSLGFEVCVEPALHRRGMPVSSSKVRQLIATGHVRQARSLLGRAFSIRSTQARGRGIGSRLVVPTINLADYDELLPAIGVYITCTRIGGEIFESVTNVGHRPTFGESSFAIESHLLNFRPLDFDGAVPVELTFLDRIRPEIKWSSAEALKAQIACDVARAQRYFRLARPRLQAALTASAGPS